MHTETDGDVGDAAADDRAVAIPDGGGDVAAAGDGDEDSVGSGTGGDAVGTPGLGRRILLSVGVIVVLLSGGIGWFVGSNGALSDAAVLGTGFAIPVTPGALALYGIAVSTAILGGLFGLVELVSRLEDDGQAE